MSGAEEAAGTAPLVPLKDLPGAEQAAPDPALLRMTLHAAVEPTQTDASAIVVELRYANGGDEAVGLLDPIDQIQYLLLDETGRPIQRPPHVPRLMVQPWDPSAAFLENRFSIVSIEENGQSLDVAEQLARRTVRLAPGTVWRLRLRIEGGDAAGEPRTARTLPEGRYGIVLTCTLVRPGSRSGAMRLLQSDALSVRISRTDV